MSKIISKGPPKGPRPNAPTLNRGGSTPRVVTRDGITSQESFNPTPDAFTKNVVDVTGVKSLAK